jgi:transcriptional regulator with XRE-family HTH domain
MRKNTSKSYALEPFAEALKAAREAKGISQRALSELSGVPQAHISKIEGNAVDLRLSSLLALAHSLDMELALVPRKALPAVKSLSRATRTSAASDPVSKDLARAVQAAARAQDALKSPELERLRTQLAEISRFPMPQIDSSMMRNIRKTVEAMNGADGTKALHDALKSVAVLRNAVVHNVDRIDLGPSRPAYRLEDDSDG